MPFQFLCSKCGAVLYESDMTHFQQLTDGPGKLPHLRALIRNKIGTRCPHCGHKLEIPPVDVKVEVYVKHGKQKKRIQQQKITTSHAPKSKGFLNPDKFDDYLQLLQMKSREAMQK